MSIFTSKKFGKLPTKNQLTKSDSKITRRSKYHPSCQLGLSLKILGSNKKKMLGHLLSKSELYVQSVKKCFIIVGQKLGIPVIVAQTPSLPFHTVERRN